MKCRFNGLFPYYIHVEPTSCSVFYLKDSRVSDTAELLSTMKTILKSILTPGETFQDWRVEIIFTSLSWT